MIVAVLCTMAIGEYFSLLSSIARSRPVLRYTFLSHAQTDDILRYVLLLRDLRNTEFMGNLFSTG